MADEATPPLDISANVIEYPRSRPSYAILLSIRRRGEIGDEERESEDWEVLGDGIFLDWICHLTVQVMGDGI